MTIKQVSQSLVTRCDRTLTAALKRIVSFRDDAFRMADEDARPRTLAWQKLLRRDLYSEMRMWKRLYTVDDDLRHEISLRFLICRYVYHRRQIIEFFIFSQIAGHSDAYILTICILAIVIFYTTSTLTLVSTIILATGTLVEPFIIRPFWTMIQRLYGKRVPHFATSFSSRVITIAGSALFLSLLETRNIFLTTQGRPAREVFLLGVALTPVVGLALEFILAFVVICFRRRSERLYPESYVCAYIFDAIVATDSAGKMTRLHRRDVTEDAVAFRLSVPDVVDLSIPDVGDSSISDVGDLSEATDYYNGLSSYIGHVDQRVSAVGSLGAASRVIRGSLFRKFRFDNYQCQLQIREQSHRMGHALSVLQIWLATPKSDTLPIVEEKLTRWLAALLSGAWDMVKVEEPQPPPPPASVGMRAFLLLRGLLVSLIPLFAVLSARQTGLTSPVLDAWMPYFLFASLLWAVISLLRTLDPLLRDKLTIMRDVFSLLKSRANEKPSGP
jgi:hypothetical protein